MHMLTSYGRPTTCLMIYGTQSKNIAHYYRPMTDPTGMESVLMTQYNMKQGIKQFGEKGMEALMTELRQLDLRRVLEPMNATALSDEEKRMALNYLMFLNEKRDGVIKGRGCADGCKQRAFIEKEQASSPTVSLEALLLTCVIDALEKRYIATTELVAVDDMMPQILWTKYFLNEQGFKIAPIRILQDNKSAILLEENGISSSSKRTRHIQVKYYFVTDQVNKKTITIERFPTKLKTCQKPDYHIGMHLNS
jgi:hypothetical protein